MRVLWLAARVLYLFSPLLFSIAISAVVHKYDLAPWLARPIDGGLVLAGRRVFGDGKTWRGVAVAASCSVAAVAFQRYVVGPRAGDLAVVDYGRVNVVAFGLAMGGGAMLGELPNSFVKRRLGIARGETATHPVSRVVFFVWDQVDLLTTSWPLLACWVTPTIPLVLMSGALALVIHPLLSLVGHEIGARASAR